MHFYNDTDEGACRWLEELMADGLIPSGEVDRRSIADVKPERVIGKRQCHWFAGIGGWPLALKLAGWGDRECWTGSAPCQPFSSAGKRNGTADERHLWPEFMRLIKACKPSVVFGEQVASSDVVGTQLEAAFLVAVQSGEFARANKLAKRLVQSSGFHFHKRWLSRVRADLAGAGYAVRWKVFGAHSVQSPHIRQRLYWVAHAGPSPSRRVIRPPEEDTGKRAKGADHSSGCCSACGLEHATSDGRQQGRAGADGRSVASGCGDGRMGDAASERRPSDIGRERPGEEPFTAGTGFWSDSITIDCRDGKRRRIPAESGVFGVADGLSPGVDGGGHSSRSRHPLTNEAIEGRAMLLRGYGNSIVPQVAAAFIRAFMSDAGICPV